MTRYVARCGHWYRVILIQSGCVVECERSTFGEAMRCAEDRLRHMLRAAA